MLQQMPNGITEKAEFGQIDAGNILFVNENVELVFSQNGKVMIKLSLRGVQPAAVANMPHFHNFVIGSNEDPGADLPDTWTKNAGRFKTFCLASNVPFDGYPIVQIVTNCIGKQVGAHIKTKIRQPKPGQNNQYDGQLESNVSKWLTPGNFQPELDSQIGGGMVQLGGVQQAPMDAPGQGTFAPPGGMPESVNPGLPQNQGPAGIQPQQSYVPPGSQPQQSYTPPPPAGPPDTPGMDTGQYIPQDQPMAPVVPGQGGYVDPNQPIGVVVPNQPAPVYDPNQGAQSGVTPNPQLPPGVM